MKLVGKEEKIGLGIIIILFLVNVFTFINGYFHRESDLHIGRVKRSVSDEGFYYEISLQSTRSLAEQAFVQTVDQKGQKQIISWDLNAKKNRLRVKSDEPLEYIEIQPPETISEFYVKNNQLFFDIWSPGVKILESYSTPEYNYIQDQEGKIWFINSIRPNNQISQGIYLTILDGDGKKVVDQKLLSKSEVRSFDPIICLAKDGVHIFWISIEEGKQNLYYGKYQLHQNELQKSAGNRLVLENGVFLKSAMAIHHPENPQVFFLREKDLSVGFTGYKLTEMGFADIGDYEFKEKDEMVGLIKQVFLLTNELNDQLLFWVVQDRYDGHVYFTKIAADGTQLCPPKKVLTFPMRSTFPVYGVYQNDQIALFYTESSEAISRSTRVAYTVLNEQGEVIRERVEVAPNPAIQVSVVKDAQGNLNLIWADKRKDGPRLSYDLFHQQLDQTYQVQIPTSIITDEEADLVAPELQQFGDERYLTWRQYHDGKYQLYIKSTHPEFGLVERKAEQKLQGRLIQWITFCFHLIQRESVKFIYLGFFNFFPLFALLGGVILLLTNTPLSNSRINWFVIYLLYLQLEYMNIRYFQRVHLFENLSIYDCNLIATVAFIIMLGLFFLINRKKQEPRMGRSILLLLGWILVTGVSLAVQNYV